MALHSLKAEPKNLHGFFSRDLSAVLTIDPGDTARYETLDAGWGAIHQAKTLGIPQDFAPRDRQRDFGHALTGPLAVRGAEPGMTLEVWVKRIRTGTWGWSAGPGLPSQMDERLGFAKAPSGPPAVITVPTGDQATMWSLDPHQGLAHNRLGQTLRMRPFMGVMGMPAHEPGVQTTFPPRFCGGNLDCKELVEQSRLYLPIAVEGGLFSVGDGHAVQGDGEVAGPALACPMELVELEFHLHAHMQLALPRAFTPAGWLTFGFHEDLNEAWTRATREMVQVMGEFYQLQPKEALALASLVMDLRITQVVNGVRGVHALLAHDAIGASKNGGRHESGVH
jgi:acetamidase/formamidase